MSAHTRFWLFAFSLIAFPAFVSAQQNGYHITLIDLSDETWVHGLNELEEIVGYAGLIHEPHSYLWDGEVETWIQLGEHPSETIVYGVNNDRKVVGFEQRLGGFYKNGEAVQFINHPQGEWTIPYGLINRGKTDTLIVGSFFNNDTETAFILLKGKTYQRVPVPGALWSRAYGVTAKNGIQVSGAYFDQNWVEKGFLVTLAPKKIVTLEVPGACATHAKGMNDLGHVVGHYDNCAGLRQGFMWDGTDYSAVDVPGAVHTLPSDINNAGEIVGTWMSGEPEFYIPRGFLATPVP